MTNFEYLRSEYDGRLEELTTNHTLLNLANEWYCENKCPYGDECGDEDDCRICVTPKEVIREYLNGEHTE